MTDAGRLSAEHYSFIRHTLDYPPPGDGWGTYSDLMPCMENLLESFEGHPRGHVRIWR